MTKLSVNVNKIATLRNARGGNMPDLVKVALDCEVFGADGITVHPRPDERHIRKSDVIALKAVLKTELNIEGNPTSDFIELVLNVKPQQVTLVPDAPEQLTSNTGWDTKTNFHLLSDVLGTFNSEGIRTSVFVNPDPAMIEYAAKAGTDRVELYTGSYASMFHKDKENAVKPYVKAAEIAHSLGLGLNSGHDLNLENLEYYRKCVPFLDEVSIGHALVCDAIYHGLEKTIKDYKRCII